MLTMLLVFRRSGDGEALGVNKFLRSGPVLIICFWINFFAFDA
jgi:hypothetical protein